MAGSRSSVISSDISILACLFLLSSLTLLLLVCLSTCFCLHLLFFPVFAAFLDRFPAHGKDGHIPLGFLNITLIPQAERESLFPSSSGLSADTHWPSVSSVPIPGPVIMPVIGQVMCMGQGVGPIPFQPHGLRVGSE